MILVQLNPIGLYTSKDKRIWDDLISNTFTVKYVTNNLPAIAFISSGTVTGTIQLYDCEDTAISGSLNLTAAVGESLEGTTCTLLSYAGSTLTSQEDGFYYYKITLSDTTVIYSDMFEWATDCSDYLKFAFTNCLNILAGGISYLIPAWDFYLQYDASGSKYETTIEVDEEEGIKNASQGSTHKIHSFELIADQNVVNLLNAFYSTGILDVATVARHIVKQHVDTDIQNGNVAVIDKIARVKHNGKCWNHFSFATKYCSFHQPQKFPIFDSFIAECFSQLSKNNYFQKKFPKNTIRNSYFEFKFFYDEFMTKQPALPQDYKEVDRYLWSSLKVQTLNKKNKLQSSPQSNQILNNAVNNTIKL